MKRSETAELLSRPTATATARSTMLHPRLGLIGLAGMILVLLMGARAVLAEPDDSLEGAIPHVASPPPTAITLSTDSADSSDNAADAFAAAEDANAAVDVPPEARDRSRVALAELLFVRSLGVSSWMPKTTDEVLAAAVAKGTNPDLEPLSPFRKRNRDLFRTERPVSIGNAEMLLRLRLRAQSRRAVSVELHF